MDHFKKFDNQLLSSYKLTLAIEGEKICREVDSILGDYEELLIEKANTYCLFCTDPKKFYIDPKLVKRCKKYLDDMRNYRDIKYTLENISSSRKLV